MNTQEARSERRRREREAQIRQIRIVPRMNRCKEIQRERDDRM